MLESPWNIFLDLHGVLADGTAVIRNYESYLVSLLAPIGITRKKTRDIHKKAYTKWIKEVRRITSGLEGDLDDPNHFMKAMKSNDRNWEQFILNFVPFDQKKRIKPYIQTAKFEYEAMANSSLSILFPEVRTVLEQLERIPNISLHIASSASSQHIEGLITRNALKRFFTKIIGYNTVEAPKKASSGRYFKKMLKITNANPNRSIFVGDSINEANLATKTGMKFIMIWRNPKPPKQVSITLNYKILTNLSELCSIIQNDIKTAL